MHFTHYFLLILYQFVYLTSILFIFLLFSCRFVRFYAFSCFCQSRGSTTLFSCVLVLY